MLRHEKKLSVTNEVDDVFSITFSWNGDTVNNPEVKLQVNDQEMVLDTQEELSNFHLLFIDDDLDWFASNAFKP